MTIFLTVLHVLVCLVLIVVVLLQHGKGADIGAVVRRRRELDRVRQPRRGELPDQAHHRRRRSSSW